MERGERQREKEKKREKERKVPLCSSSLRFLLIANFSVPIPPLLSLYLLPLILKHIHMSPVVPGNH